MPAETALEILKVFRKKKELNPTASDNLLYKYVLWDRFEGKMIMDSELDEMATKAKSLPDLVCAIIFKERPKLQHHGLEKDVCDEVRSFFARTAPEYR